jgi:hypothetical protein
MSATATVKGGLFETANVSSLTQVGSPGNARRVISQQMTDSGMAAVREKEVTLNGAAAGSAAVATRARVEANVELGGKRTIEQFSVVNANTVAGDVTDVTNTMLKPLNERTSFGSSPPENKDGNPLGTR